MAIQLQERPGKICFSKNEARYVFYINNWQLPGCAVDIKIFKHGIQSAALPPEEVFSTRVYPNASGKVVFYVQDFLRSFLEPVVPDPSLITYFLPQQQQLYFWVEYRQITTAVPNNTWVTTERSRKRVMIWGGIEKQIYDRDNFFNYIEGNKMPLTWAPQPKMLGMNQLHYVTYLRSSDAITGLTLKWRAFFSGGDQEDGTVELEEADVAASRLYHLPAGPLQLGLLQLQQENYPDELLHYYEIEVVDQDDEQVLSPMKFYIDYDQSYQYFDWLFVNSISGLDSIRVRGSYNVDVQRQSIENELRGVLETVGEAFKRGANIVAAALLNKTYKGDVGMLHQAAEQDWLLELLASPLIVEFNGTERWLRVTLDNKNAALAPSDDTRWNFPLEWNYTHTNEVHTPKNIPLGVGNSGDEEYDQPAGLCPVPFDLDFTVVSVSPNTTIEFTWDGTSTFYEFQYRNVESATWETEIAVGSTASLELANDGATYEWRVKAICSNQENSGYMLGESFTVDANLGVCAQPTNLVASPISYPIGQVEFQLEWDTAAASSICEYRKKGAADWTAVTTSSNSITITLNATAEEYEWRVMSNCGGGSESIYVKGANFFAVNTGICAMPQNLQVERLPVLYDEGPGGPRVTFRFRLSWNHPAAVNFVVRYHKYTEYYSPIAVTTSARSVIIGFEYPDPLPGWAINEIYYNGQGFRWTVAATCSPGNLSSAVQGPDTQLQGDIYTP